jgi:hypothetical protein
LVDNTDHTKRDVGGPACFYNKNTLYCSSNMRFLIPFLLAISVSAKTTHLPQSPLTKSSYRSGRAAAATKNIQRIVPTSDGINLLTTTRIPRGGNAVDLSSAASVGSRGSPLKLLIGVGGIYAAFMKYGLLQEAVFHYKAKDGSSFEQVWFLMVLEALANVLVGFIGELMEKNEIVPLSLNLISF